MSLLPLAIAIGGIFISFPTAFWLGWMLGKDSVLAGKSPKPGACRQITSTLEAQSHVKSA
jgi:hypothetical protein